MRRGEQTGSKEQDDDALNLLFVLAETIKMGLPAPMGLKRKHLANLLCP